MSETTKMFIWMAIAFIDTLNEKTGLREETGNYKPDDHSLML